MSLTEWACNADTNIPNDNSRPGWATHYSGLGSTQSTSPFEAFLGAANPQMTAVHAASRRDASMITSSAAMLTSQGSSVPACAGWKVCTPWPPTGSCCKREESRRSPRSFRGCARRRTDLSLAVAVATRKPVAALYIAADGERLARAPRQRGPRLCAGQRRRLAGIGRSQVTGRDRPRRTP